MPTFCNTTARDLYGVDPDAGLVDYANEHGRNGHEAFEQLVTRHQSWVYRLCLRRLRHPQDAQDATQNALLKAFLGLPGFNGNSTFRTWLAAIVERECIDTSRRRARQTMTSELAADLETFQRQHLPEHDTQDARAGDLRQVVAALPAPNRKVIELRFYQERAIDDLAASLGIGLSAAKMRLYRSLAQLRARLGQRDMAATA